MLNGRKPSLLLPLPKAHGPPMQRDRIWYLSWAMPAAPHQLQLAWLLASCPTVGSGPQHPLPLSLAFSWKLQGHLESWVLPSLGLFPSRDASWLQDGPGPLGQIEREGRSWWALAGSRRIWVEGPLGLGICFLYLQLLLDHVPISLLPPQGS